MGGGPSKAEKREHEQLKEERDRKIRENAEEAENLRRRQRDQEDRMNREIESRNRDIERMRNNHYENMRRNEEEVRKTIQAQEKRAAELENQRKEEMAALRNSSEADKKRVADQFEKRAAELQKQHEEVMKRAEAERERDKKKRDEDIQKAETERDEVKKRKLENTKQYRKDLDEMMVKHRQTVNEHYDQMSEKMEQHTLAIIDQIVEENEKKLAIADANYELLKHSTKQALYGNIFKEYMQILSQADKLDAAIGDMNVVMTAAIGNEKQKPIKNDENNTSIEFPSELRGIHSNYNTDSVLLQQKLNSLRLRLRMSFDISEELKQILINPLDTIEDSASNVKDNSIKILMAQQRNDVRALEPVAQSFAEHRKVISDALKQMKAINYQEHVQAALENNSQRSIENN